MNPATGDDGSARPPVSFVGRDLPAWAVLRVVIIEPGDQLAYVESDWRDAIVVVEEGDVVLATSSGAAAWLTCGDTFWLSGTGVRTIHNHGDGRAVLAAVSRGAVAGTNHCGQPWRDDDADHHS